LKHEQPFYQLGKNYVYELKCELFEYEDEVIDTSIDEIDTQVQDQGYISTLKLIGVGRTASGYAILNTGYIKQIFLNNDGYGYRTPPVVAISSSPTGNIGDNASAIAFTVNKGGTYSIEKVLLTNPGIGYTVPPTITFVNRGSGVGAVATCSIETSLNGVQRIVITDSGDGYVSQDPPTVSISIPKHVAAAATAIIASPVGSGVSVISTVISQEAPKLSISWRNHWRSIYKRPPIVTFSLPTGAVGAVAVASAVMGNYQTTGGIVSSITLPPETSGTYYTSTPAVTINHPGYSFAFGNSWYCRIIY
jgi:hypothetical protein